MKRLLTVFLLALAMPASGAGQVVRVPASGDAQRVEIQRPGGGPFEAMVLGGRGTEIGVTIRDIDPADADSQKAAANAGVTGGAGVIVEQVRPGGPAATAGLRAGDLLVSFDGERVRSSQQFSRLVRETPPGRAVAATVVRDGRRSDVTITPLAPQSRREDDRGRRDPGAADRDIVIERGGDVIVDRDALRERFEREFEKLDGLRGRLDIPDFNFELPGSSARGRLGVGVEGLTAQLAAYFGATEGVLITTVEENTPASRGGLKAGDVIVTFNGETVRNRAELQRAVARVQADAEVAIGIVRDRKQSDLKVTFEGMRRTTRRQV